MLWTELQAILEARPDIANVGSPVLQGGAGATPDPHGYYLYNVAVMEQQGAVGSTVQVAVKIKDLGGAGEDAYFMGRVPTPNATTSVFKDWLKTAYLASTQSYSGLLMHHVDELAECAICSWLNRSTWEREYYYVERDTDGQGTPLVQLLPSFDVSALDHTVGFDRER